MLGYYEDINLKMWLACRAHTAVEFTRFFLTLLFIAMLFTLSAVMAEEKVAPGSSIVKKKKAEQFYKKPHIVDLESSKVIIYPDGTWMPYTVNGQLIIEGTSDVGDNIVVKFLQDKEGKITRKWSISDGGGVVEVFISRLRYSFQNKKCIPTIGIRNFNQTGLTSAVVNVMFKAPITGSDVPYKYTGMSLMFVNLDPSEQSTKQGTPVFVDRSVQDCDTLEALVTVGHCQLKNGINCEGIVRVSPFSSIPLSRKKSTKALMDEVEGRDTGSKYTRGE